MIKASYPRLGLLVQKTLLELLSQEYYTVMFRKLMAEYQSQPPDRVYFHSGKSKLDSVFPNIGFEIQGRQDSWAALAYTKDIQYTFAVYVAVKALTGAAPTAEGKLNEVEAYLISLAEFVFEALNEPLEALQYAITEDQDGKPLRETIKIYDSMASTIQYGFLYNGALRTAQINWTGHVMRLGQVPAEGQQTGY